MSSVFVVSIQVKNTGNSIIPIGLDGACVRCYVAAEDQLIAITRSMAKLKLDGVSVEGILEPVEQMEQSEWTYHINEYWPEHNCTLLTQSEFEAAMSAGTIVYGPFEVYSSL